MKVTRVNINRIADDVTSKGLIADCSIVFDYNFKVNGVKLKNGARGYYIIFPTDSYNMGLAFPIKNEYREEILNKILEKLGV